MKYEKFNFLIHPGYESSSSATIYQEDSDNMDESVDAISVGTDVTELHLTKLYSASRKCQEMVRLNLTWTSIEPGSTYSQTCPGGARGK